jgi:Ring finger domain
MDQNQATMQSAFNAIVPVADAVTGRIILAFHDSLQDLTSILQEVIREPALQCNDISGLENSFAILLQEQLNILPTSYTDMQVDYIHHKVMLRAQNLTNEAFQNLRMDLRRHTEELHNNANLQDIVQSTGQGIRDPECKVCYETIQADAPTITHDDDSCMNTFCKECFDAWAEHAPASRLSCPTCRVTLSYVRPQQEDNGFWVTPHDDGYDLD